MIRRFARPYARALLGWSPDLEAAQRLRGELGAFASAMAAVPKIAVMAANPGVPAEVKSRTVAQIAGVLELEDEARRFLELLVQKTRLAQLPEILEAVDALIHQRLRVSTARVWSAGPLDDRQQESLRGTLEQVVGHRVQVELAVDPELLGGFVAQVGSDRYDVSLKGQLERMSARLAVAAERSEP